MSGNPKRKIVIDADPGIDDAQAILMALGCPNVEVVGITTVAGNVPIQKTTNNVLRILKMANKSVPVYQGCTSSILPCPVLDASFYHGKDGLGDVPDPKPVDNKHLLSTEHAVSALSTLGKKYAKDVELVCLSPLTNVALALRLDPNLSTYYSRCIIMGGTHSYRGNCGPMSEFNFHKDPEAARIVLQEFDTDVTVLPWETCVDYPFSWDWYRATLVNATAPCLKWAYAIERQVISSYFGCGKDADSPTTPGYIMADQLAMAACLNPDTVITRKEQRPVKVLLGSECRGVLAVDRRTEVEKDQERTEGWRQRTVVTGIDCSTVEHNFKAYISSL